MSPDARPPTRPNPQTRARLSGASGIAPFEPANSRAFSECARVCGETKPRATGSAGRSVRSGQRGVNAAAPDCRGTNRVS
jgi:hypothetical protein